MAGMPPPERREPTALESAVRWLREVDGRLLHKPRADDPRDGWVAVVKTPALPDDGAQVILAFGDSPVAAVETAQERWDAAWRRRGAVH